MQITNKLVGKYLYRHCRAKCICKVNSLKADEELESLKDLFKKSKIENSFEKIENN